MLPVHPESHSAGSHESGPRSNADPSRPLAYSLAYPWASQWTRLAHGLGIHPGTPVTLALSGGADSVFLLHLVARSVPRPRILAVHIDHGLRGEDSIEDAAYCARLCARLGVPFARRHVEVEAGADLEARLRKARYEALLDESANAGIDALLTGHHSDDALETLLMRMMRGGELGGLTGPARETVLGRRDGRPVRVLRPLLHLRREEVRAILRREGLDWREDASNASPVHTRNRVRHGLLPTIEQSCGEEGVENLRRFAGAVEGLEAELANRTAHLAWQAPEAFGSAGATTSGGDPDPDAFGGPHGPNRISAFGGSLPRTALTDLAPPLQRRALVRLLVEGTGQAPSREVLESVQADLAEGSNARRTLPGDWSLQLRADRVHLSPPTLTRGAGTQGTSASGAPAPIGGDGLELGLPGAVHLPDGRALLAEVVDMPPGTHVPRDAYEVELDAEAVERSGRSLHVRNMRPGDVFHPLGGPGRRPLGRFFTDAGIPRELRPFVPLVYAGDELVWIAGVRPSETHRVQAGTRRRLRLRLEGLEASPLAVGEDAHEA